MLRAAKTDCVNVPILRMDPRAVPRRQRLEAWQELASPVFAVSALVPDREFDAGWELCRLDQLIIARVSFSAQLFDHDPRALTRYDNDHLLLEFYEQGCGRGVVSDTPTYVDSRRIHLVDLSRRYRTATGDVRASAVVIPHAAVGYDPSRHGPYCAFPTESPRGRMLLAAFRALSGQLATLQEADAPVLAAAFAGLVRTLLLPDRSEAAMATAAAADLATVQDFIDRHLTDAHLGVDLLCRRFGMSRATLYRQFKELGGVDRYIRQRRLDRCFAALTAAPPTRSRVRTVAARWGFEDASHFHRLFRQRFGIAPSGCLGAGRPQPPEDPPPVAEGAPSGSLRLFGDWLAKV